MAIAWVENGVVTELRELSMDAVPAHKRDWWRIVEGEPPPYNAETERLHGPTYQVSGDRVVRVWEVRPAPPAPEDKIAQLEAQIASMQALLVALAEEAKAP